MENIIMKLTTIHGDTIELVVTEVKNHNGISPYARWFDWECTGWVKDKNWNKMFLAYQERFLNDRLKAKGHLYLNEVYDQLGMSKTKTGQLVGWIYDENKVAKIDILEIKEDGGLLLDFNVDGIIIDKMN